MFRKSLFIISFLLFSMSSFALDKATIKASLDQMRKSGMFTQAQIDAAEKQLSGMSEEDLSKLKEKGEAAAKDPAVRAKAEKIINQMQNSN